MRMESICKSYFIKEPELDYQRAEEIGQFRFGAEAVYIRGFPKIRYLPLAAIQRAWVQKSALVVSGSRGAEIALYVLRAQYRGGPTQNFTFSKNEDAQYALRQMRKLNPALPGAPEDV